MNTFEQRVESSKTQGERWELYQQAVTEQEKEFILRKILANARNIGEVAKVHKYAPAHSALEAEAINLLGGAQGLIPAM